MRGRRNLSLIGQHVQERLRLCGAHVAWMPHDPATSMPAGEKAHPIEVGLLRLEAIVQIPDALPKLVQEPDRGKRRRAGFHACFTPE